MSTLSRMDTTGSFVYSLSRPLHPKQPQTNQYKELEEYAYRNEIQVAYLGSAKGIVVVVS